MSSAPVSERREHVQECECITDCVSLLGVSEIGQHRELHRCVMVTFA